MYALQKQRQADLEAGAKEKVQAQVDVEASREGDDGTINGEETG